jgi:hypothetical protein
MPAVVPEVWGSRNAATAPAGTSLIVVDPGLATGQRTEKCPKAPLVSDTCIAQVLGYLENVICDKDLHLHELVYTITVSTFRVNRIGALDHSASDLGKDREGGSWIHNCSRGSGMFSQPLWKVLH